MLLIWLTIWHLSQVIVHNNSQSSSFIIPSISTVVSRYYDIGGIRKKYHNIQTIELSSTNFLCFVVVGILIWYRNKQHFELSDIVIRRDYCIWSFVRFLQVPSSHAAVFTAQIKLKCNFQYTFRPTKNLCLVESLKVGLMAVAAKVKQDHG